MMSSARRRESSAGYDPSVAAGSKFDGAGGSSSDFDGEEFSPSQHRKVSLKENDGLGNQIMLWNLKIQRPPRA
jgi:hypothetical protein